MENFDPNIAHITCNKCGKHWQVLNEEGTEWDESATAEVYYAEAHDCENALAINTDDGKIASNE